MEAALLLLFFVFIELGLTIWLLAKHFEYLKRIKRIESTMYRYQLNSVPDPTEIVENENIDSLVAKATPEDIEQARQVLKALGLGGKDGGTE